MIGMVWTVGMRAGWASRLSRRDCAHSLVLQFCAAPRLAAPVMNRFA